MSGMQWPEGEDFLTLVSAAMKPRSGGMGGRMRDRLAEPDVIERTIDALGAIVDRIDAQLAAGDEDSDRRLRRAAARDFMWDWLVWYQTLAGIGTEDG